jgi:hypothetical protein
VELETTDPAGAKRFYSRLFDWAAEDYPIGENQSYTMFRIDGLDVAAVCQATSSTPIWMLYVCISDAKCQAKKATSLGARIVHKPSAHAQFCTTAVLQDRSGALFGVWQPHEKAGFGLGGEDNCFCWADLVTHNPAQAADFYSELFGWTLEGGHGTDGYLHIQNEGEMIGGIPPARPAGVSDPHWLIYFQTADCDGLAHRAEREGAKLVTPPMSLSGVGRIAVIADPAGAVFALYEPQDAA